MSQGGSSGVQHQAWQLAARLGPQVNRLAWEMVMRQHAEIPGFGHVADELLDTETAAAARHALRLFIRAAADCTAIAAGTGLLQEQAAERAEEGIPLRRLLQSYQVGSRVLSEALAEAARPGEEAALLWLTRHQAELLGTLTERVTESYLGALGRGSTGSQELARALLSGSGYREAAARNGLSLGSEYTVVAAWLPGAATEVPLRRLLRRLTAQLEGLADGPVLGLVQAAGAHLLVPAALPLATVRKRLAPSPAEVFAAGYATATCPGAVANAAARALRIASVAGWGGVHGIEDVLLDYHLSAPSDSAAELGGLVETLSRHPGLLPTVRAFLACDLHRRRAARQLNVHPNTIDNRLARVSELLGVDPRTTRGVQLLGAALSVHGRGGPSAPGSPPWEVHRAGSAEDAPAVPPGYDHR